LLLLLEVGGNAVGQVGFLEEKRREGEARVYIPQDPAREDSKTKMDFC